MINRFFQLAFTVLILAIVVGCDDDLPDNLTADSAYAAELRERLTQNVSAEGGSEEALAGPAGYGTIKGTFTFDGEVPALTQLTVSPECSTGENVYDKSIAVDSATKGLADVVIFLDKVPDAWVHESAKTPATEEIIFDQKNCVFLTRVVAMHTAQRMKVLNSDPFGHNLKVKSFNQSIPANGNGIFQSNKADAVPQKMSCSVHPWMSAWFIGRDNTYFAVTNPDGTFEIPNVPAGVELTVKVWHERPKFISGEVTQNGQPTKWKKGKLDLTVQPDSTTELNVVLNASMFN
ncbi:MAG: hypothetical protein KDB27_30990 [Planctomycetales bacterium]|nr:hypothetical protein [Planctomycetales bacterium]